MTGFTVIVLTATPEDAIKDKFVLTCGVFTDKVMKNTVIYIYTYTVFTAVKATLLRHFMHAVHVTKNHIFTKRLVNIKSSTNLKNKNYFLPVKSKKKNNKKQNTGSFLTAA